MSEVTRYRWDEEEDGSPCLRPDPSGDYMLAADHLAADHLAALERVRVETLREARAVVAALVTQSSMSLGHRGSWGDGQRDALAAVDRLIDAAGGA